MVIPLHTLRLFSLSFVPSQINAQPPQFCSPVLLPFPSGHPLELFHLTFGSSVFYLSSQPGCQQFPQLPPLPIVKRGSILSLLISLVILSMPPAAALAHSTACGRRGTCCSRIPFLSCTFCHYMQEFPPPCIGPFLVVPAGISYLLSSQLYHQLLAWPLPQPIHLGFVP